MLFEIHMTAADDSIHEAADDLKIKTIAVNLLRPDLSILRTEHMTSHAQDFSDFDECKKFVNDLAFKFRNRGIEMVRTKIETPFSSSVACNSVYIESHWKQIISGNYFGHRCSPLSQNQNKLGSDKYLATDRLYDRKYFDLFNDAYKNNATVELCLYDSFVEEDADWFNLYDQGSMSYRSPDTMSVGILKLVDDVRDAIKVAGGLWSVDKILLKLLEEAGELAKAFRNKDRANQTEELGDVLFTCVALAISEGFNVEESLQTAIRKPYERLNRQM